MNCAIIFICVSFQLIAPSASLFRKIVPIISEKFENCAEPAFDYRVVDTSNYELIAVNDLEVYINGSIKILKDVVGPTPFHIFAERFERGQWVVMYYDTKRADFCRAMKNPTEIWYEKLKDLQGCPLKPGVSRLIFENIKKKK